MSKLTLEQFAKMTKRPSINRDASQIATEVVEAYNTRYPDPIPNPHDRARSVLGNQVIGGEVLPERSRDGKEIDK